jgi:hypothetical protein
MARAQCRLGCQAQRELSITAFIQAHAELGSPAYFRSNPAHHEKSITYRKKSALFKAYAKVKLLVMDDLGLTPLTDGQSRDHRRSLRQTVNGVYQSTSH